MNPTQTTFAIGAFLISSACNTFSAQQDVPAVIIDPTPQSRDELLRVVTGALNGASVKLAEDALTRSSLLTIERNQPRDLQGRFPSGRELGTPEQFQLVVNGSRCVLVHRRDGERWELAETTCTPE